MQKNNHHHRKKSAPAHSPALESYKLSEKKIASSAMPKLAITVQKNGREDLRKQGIPYTWFKTVKFGL